MYYYQLLKSDHSQDDVDDEDDYDDDTDNMLVHLSIIIIAEPRTASIYAMYTKSI